MGKKWCRRSRKLKLWSQLGESDRGRGGGEGGERKLHIYTLIRGEMMSGALPSSGPISLQEQILSRHCFNCRTLGVPIQRVIHSGIAGVEDLID